MFFPAAAKGNLSTDTLFVGGRSKLLLRFLQLQCFVVGSFQNVVFFRSGKKNSGVK
jgi:hypothetical protein